LKRRLTAFGLLGAGLLGACGSKTPSPVKLTLPALDAGIVRQRARITATVGSTRFVAREHFLAAAEMQVSGEPLAEAMGRDLGNYSRDHVPPDLYFDTSSLASGPWIDLAGFSTAVESYEYSKQPMNGVALESGAGTSLAHGPLVNPEGVSGDAATALLAARVQHFAAASNALGRFVFPAGTYPVDNPRSGNTNPEGKGVLANNPLGWPGLWPTTHVFRSFDPSIDPTSAIDLGCTVSSDDDPGATGALACADYECDYGTLHLRDRNAQVESVVTPGADGFSAWKYGLWVLNYLQSMHDSGEASVQAVADGDLSAVGAPENQVVGRDASGAATAAGTYLGSSDIEGFQAAMFIDELDNRAEDWLSRLTTVDGATLSGFASTLDALSYGYDSPLRWFPGKIAVSESNDGGVFPRPSYTVGSADSDLLDQIGLALGYAELYALTDTRNRDVGGSQPAMAYFDGDPFPMDDQEADGEATLHDRALGIVRVALIDIDRMHADPGSGVLVDSVKMAGATPERGTTASTTYAAYALLGLRTVLRSLGSQLELYSNNKPDTAVVATPLDDLPVHGGGTTATDGGTADGGSGGTFTERLVAMARAEADLLFEHLSDPSGRAYDGWDVVKGAPLDDQDLLDSHTAAVRGLFAAYFITGDVRYRERAKAVFERLESVFYDPEARIYGSTPAPVDTVEYTPLRFALLQSTLRDMYEIVAARPGGEALEPVLEERLGRLDKLVLNGWDDRDQNRFVKWDSECVDVVDGLPRGGLQMAERTLTGETGSQEDRLEPGQKRTQTSDREHDCVPEIDDAHLPSALADSVTFHVAR
jgi:hypothetical protein